MKLTKSQVDKNHRKKVKLDKNVVQEVCDRLAESRKKEIVATNLVRKRLNLPPLRVGV